MTRLISAIRRRLDVGHFFVSRFILIVLSIQCGLYSTLGLWILAHRPQGSHVTSEEVSLIGLFIGINGMAFILNAKSRGSKDD